MMAHGDGLAAGHSPGCCRGVHKVHALLVALAGGGPPPKTGPTLAEAGARYPQQNQKTERALWYLGELQRRGIPVRSALVPGR